MKIADMKMLLNIHSEWTQLKKELSSVYYVYGVNHKKIRGYVLDLDKDSVEKEAVNFLQIVADLYGEEYDELNQCVDFHLNFGTYTVLFDKSIHEDSPCFLGLKMSPLVEGYEDTRLTQEEIGQFFDDNVGCEFRDLKIE